MKRNRDEWKKVVTGMKEALGLKYSTRKIYSTEGLQNAIKDMAFMYAKEHREEDKAYNVKQNFCNLKL